MPSYSFPFSFTAVNGNVGQQKTTLLGKGLKSPLEEDPVTGDFKRIEGEDNVRQCLRDGILTALGERPGREGLGTIIRDMTFEQEDIVADVATPSVKDFIEAFEPRVILRGVTIRQKPINSTELVYFVVQVNYVIRATNTGDSLVFPFFLQSELT
jgi:phage baseplate assembly protein W